MPFLLIKNMVDARTDRAGTSHDLAAIVERIIVRKGKHNEMEYAI
jgi:hypothetical protein